MRKPFGTKSFRNADDGNAFVEAALVVPLLIAIFVGIFDMGRAYTTLSAAQKSLRSAVRYLTVLPAPAVCTWGLTNATNLALYGHIGAPVTGEVRLVNLDDITLTPTTCNETTLKTQPIRMEASVEYTPLIASSLAIPGSITMTASHEERWIGE